MKKIVTTILFSVLFCAFSSAADRDSLRQFDRYQFIQMGTFQFGTSLAHSAVNSTNSEFMLLLNGLDLSGNLTRLTPYVSYAYAKDRAVGVSFNYTSARAQVDAATLDILNDGLQFSVEDLAASYVSSGISVFHRQFFGLDPLSRFGIYYDTRLSYTSGRTEITGAGDEGSFTSSKKYGFDFTPGIMVFVRDNISIHAGVSIADVSYNTSDVYSGGQVTGSHSRFISRIKLDPLGLVFGMSIHL